MTSLRLLNYIGWKYFVSWLFFFSNLLQHWDCEGEQYDCLLSPEIGQLWAEIGSQMWPLMPGLGMLLLAPSSFTITTTIMTIMTTTTIINGSDSLILSKWGKKNSKDSLCDGACMWRTARAVSVFDSEIIDIDFFPWEQRDILRVGGLTGQELASGDYQDKPQTAPSSLLGLPQNFYFFRELIFFSNSGCTMCSAHGIVHWLSRNFFLALTEVQNIGALSPPLLPRHFRRHLLHPIRGICPAKGCLVSPSAPLNLFLLSVPPPSSFPP